MLVGEGVQMPCPGVNGTARHYNISDYVDSSNTWAVLGLAVQEDFSVFFKHCTLVQAFV